MQQETSAMINSGAGYGRASFQDDDLVSDTSRSQWRREEHGRFMQALEIYGSRRTGNEWKDITDYVGTRSIEDVRLHGRQYLQRLVQQLPPSPVMMTPSRYFSTGSQNDPNRQNYQVPRQIDPQKTKDGQGKRMIASSLSGSRSLSAAALEAAQTMSIAVPVPFYNQLVQPVHHQLQQQLETTAPHRNGRRKPWTFQEDKAFETALAGWAGCKAYPWAKIAAVLPGKTVKEVRSRFNEMVGEVASIESSDASVPENSALSGSGETRKLRSTSTLSRRAVPPPPIEVPPNSAVKDGAVGSFPSSTRSRRGSITMLSPTFLDLLAKEAESEEKSPLPVPFPGLTNLPSPLFSPTLLPSGSPGFFSPGNKKSAARGQPDRKVSTVEGSDDVKVENLNRKPSTAATKSDDPKRSATPRIWNDFLAEDFKFDDPLKGTPSHSNRKKSRSKMATRLVEGSSNTKKPKGEDKQEVKMKDASAA